MSELKNCPFCGARMCYIQYERADGAAAYTVAADKKHEGWCPIEGDNLKGYCCIYHARDSWNARRFEE